MDSATIFRGFFFSSRYCLPPPSLRPTSQQSHLRSDLVGCSQSDDSMSVSLKTTNGGGRGLGRRISDSGLKYAALKVFPFLRCLFPSPGSTYRRGAGAEPDNLCQLFIAIAPLKCCSQGQRKWVNSPLIPSTLGGIRVNTRTTRTSVISLALLLATLYFIHRFLYSLSSRLAYRLLKKHARAHTVTQDNLVCCTTRGSR